MPEEHDPGALEPVSRLSRREQQVASMVLEGRTYREIAEDLFISVRTVEHHVARMRRRVGASNRSDLFALLRTELSAIRWENGPSFEPYMRDVEQVKRIGYASDVDNYVSGITTVSSPILDSQRSALMALSAVGFSAQFSKIGVESLGEDLRQRCSDISYSISGGTVQLDYSNA